MAIYSKTTYEAVDDADLEFRLRRSIAIAKEQKAMGKKKAESKERASVSKERRLALALRAVLDSIEDQEPPFEMGEGMVAASNEASRVLSELGYGLLVGIPTRVKELNEQLKAAVDAGDGKEIARLGLELERAKAGKPPVVVKGEKVKAAAGE